MRRARGGGESMDKIKKTSRGGGGSDVLVEWSQTGYGQWGGAKDIRDLKHTHRVSLRVRENRKLRRGNSKNNATSSKNGPTDVPVILTRCCLMSVLTQGRVNYFLKQLRRQKVLLSRFALLSEVRQPRWLRSPLH
ncbi:hypothetical protein ElyMa_006181800 [Elysia marginata]|uniref:Uncharacterized protein n=1 Tax=Elysia marginata TaxID=1093978 RepID=A0AAV4H4X3_9GAST|nr:hypothetical protein ElyMa_006181800 [Elysia marginata]